MKASKKRPKPETDDEDEDSLTIDHEIDGEILDTTPPKGKKQKKDTAIKKSAGKPLQDLENEASMLDGAEDAKPKKGGASEQYQKVVILVSLMTILELTFNVAYPARAHHQASGHIHWVGRSHREVHVGL